MLLEGKNAIVTGASSGIGYAAAHRLATEGARVVINYNQREEEANALVAELKSKGGDATAVRADVSTIAGTEAIFQACQQAFGAPDILVANAGTATMMPLAETTEAEYDRVFNLNVKGTLFLLKQAAQHLRDNGRAVIVSSTTTLFTLPGVAIYAGSKAALRSITDVAAQELGVRGITVNSVLPGVTDTALAKGLPPDFKQRVAESSPFGRIGQPEDIADVICYLASEGSRWVTGQHIVVNGGAKQ